MSEKMMGRVVSSETREKLSRANTGYRHTTEAKQKMSLKRQGKDNPMFGRTPYQIWTQKYGKEEADRRYLEWKEKVSPKNRKNFI